MDSTTSQLSRRNIASYTLTLYSVINVESFFFQTVALNQLHKHDNHSREPATLLAIVALVLPLGQTNEIEISSHSNLMDDKKKERTVPNIEQLAGFEHEACLRRGSEEEILMGDNIGLV